jgi:hypothetical protein
MCKHPVRKATLTASFPQSFNESCRQRVSYIMSRVFIGLRHFRPINSFVFLFISLSRLPIHASECNLFMNLTTFYMSKLKVKECAWCGSVKPQTNMYLVAQFQNLTLVAQFQKLTLVAQFQNLTL